MCHRFSKTGEQLTIILSLQPKLNHPSLTDRIQVHRLVISPMEALLWVMNQLLPLKKHFQFPQWKWWNYFQFLGLKKFPLVGYDLNLPGKGCRWTLYFNLIFPFEHRWNGFLERTASVEAPVICFCSSCIYFDAGNFVTPCDLLYPSQDFLLGTFFIWNSMKIPNLLQVSGKKLL